MEDASLASLVVSRDSNTPQSVIEVEPEVIESMGSEKHVYFAPEREQVAHSKSLAEMSSVSENGAGSGDSEDRGSGSSAGVEEMMVARVSAESQASKASSLKLWIEADKVRLFDPKTERIIT